jgi:hypothetical protein
MNFVGLPGRGVAQTVTLDTSPSGRGQTIDGFGTCLSGTEAQQAWWQNLYFTDLQCSIVRMDLTPPFKAPWNGTNGTYNSPWFHNNPPLPGPETNNVRTYTGPTNYSRLYNGWSCPIPVMGTNIDTNVSYFDYSSSGVNVAAGVATAGFAQSGRLGSFKLIGSLWSPMPWVKMSSGNTISGQSYPGPANGTAYPFIWYNNFSGGVLDASGVPLEIFNDGTGPTSSLTQFARGIAAYLRGFQKTFGVQYYAISIQNELNFEEFYNSCLYPLSAPYLAAIKAVRAELDKYPDLAPIKLMGPEDLLGGDPYGLWQYGSGSTGTHKNLQFLQNIEADPTAATAEAFFCIHGYAGDGVSAANAVPTQWNWWANGWTNSPAAGIPANVNGFTAFGKKSWMTETSGENPAWLWPTNGFPGQGAWSLALRIHDALTAGQESAWVYWQLTDGSPVGAQELTDSARTNTSPKYVAAKHFFRYIRPNSVRVNAAVSDTTNLNVSAYLNETNGTMTVVLINVSANAVSASVNTPAAPVGIVSWQTFTSSNGSYWRPSTATVTNGSAPVSVPGYGVVTLFGVGLPKLQAVLSADDLLTLSWPAVATGFQLQSSTDLGAAISWTAITNLPATNNGQTSVTIGLGSGAPAQFYRLANP